MKLFLILEFSQSVFVLFFSVEVFLDYFREDVLPLYLDEIAEDPVKGLCDAIGDAANHELGKAKWLTFLSREAASQLRQG